MNEYIYFFKHLNVSGVKIGRTSGESVDNRFMQFKTYSPFGAKVLGYYQTFDSLKEEQILHNRFYSKRLSGEFFDIAMRRKDFAAMFKKVSQGRYIKLI